MQDKYLFVVVGIYVILMLSVIDWGIPNSSRPFTYHMDEWHQLQAVRTTFKDLSANVPGSAHGTMFQYILSGFYLIPFYILGIINPFALRSSVDLLTMQQKLFEILRLNTLIFGSLSIFFVAKTAKNYLKTNPVLTAILFTATPLWLAMSNYFKYDIALTFWIILFLFLVLKFNASPTLKNYLIAGISCSLAVATKISAMPLVVAYVFSFFWFVKKPCKKITYLLGGVLVFFAVFVLFGIPDLVLGRGDWEEFLYSNLVAGPDLYSNLLISFKFWWQYIFIKIFSLDFGYGFYLIYLIGILYWLMVIMGSYLKKKYSLFKNEQFLLFSFLLFVLSLISLGVGANGNRLLVLLPFFALLSASFLQRSFVLFKRQKLIIASIFMLIAIIQFYQSAIMVYVKLIPDVRQLSSQWIMKNINAGSTIGIENIPIYQMLPDIIVKEFHSKERIASYSARYKYEVIDSTTKPIPNLVVVTNKDLELSFFRSSPKKLLIERLEKERYKEVIEFKPPSVFYIFSGNYLNSYISGLVPIPTISIFERI